MSKLKDYRKIFAWTSIYLIISLTFFSANALAFNYRVSGEDLVNKWREPNDITIFYVNASANVSIETGPDTWQQMICEQHSNTSYTCEYFLDRNTLGPTINNVTRKLRQETATPTEYTTTINVDRLPPKIEKLNITQIGSALKVSYSIKDYSFQNRPGCSGLDYITYIVGPEADTIEFNTTICEYNSTVVFNESGFYQEDFTISITAYDRLGLSVTNTTILTVDLAGPDIQEWQIERNGQVIDILSKSPENMQYDVVVFIDEPKLAINKVRGDLSGLHTNPQWKNTLKNKQAACIKESENLYKCTFSAIPIKPASTNLQISVNAYDTSGNYANETLQKTVTLLDDPGQITYVGPLKEHCTTSLSKCYTTDGSQMFIAEISPGSNFSAMIFGFNTETKVGPCFFQEQENKWQCVYRYTVPNIAQLKVYIPAISTDIYGNQVSYVERNVIVDTVDPILLNNITSNLPSCAVSSDTLELTVNAKESVSETLKIYADTSGFTNSEMTNGTCEKTVNDEWACTLSINGFVTEHPPVVRKVVVEDLAGNKAEKEFIFEVCAEDSNAVPNYITTITPNIDIIVDRRTASLLPIKTYVPLTISKSSSAKIIEMTVDNCQAEDENGLSLIDSGHYFIDNTLVLYVGFDGAVLPDEEFEINCTVNSRIRAGNKVFLKPEQDSFIITAKPYNNPLGLLNSAVEKKISDQKSAIRDLDGEIKTRSTINSIVMTVCTIAQIFVKINRLLQLLKSVIYVVCLGLEIGFGVGDKIWQAIGGVLNDVDRQIQKHLWPTNLLSANWYAYAIKSTCLLYTCRHYSVDGLIEIGFTASTIIGAIGFVQEENRLSAKIGEGTLSDDGKTYTTKDGKTYTKTTKDGNDVWTNTKDPYDVKIYNTNSGQWSLYPRVTKDGVEYDIITLTNGETVWQDGNGNRYKLVDDKLQPIDSSLNPGIVGTSLPGGNSRVTRNGVEYDIITVNGETLYQDGEGNRYKLVDNNLQLVNGPALPVDPPKAPIPPVKKNVDGVEYIVTKDKNGKELLIAPDGTKGTLVDNKFAPIQSVKLPKTYTYKSPTGAEVELTLNKEGLYVGKDDKGFTFVHDPNTGIDYYSTGTYGDSKSEWTPIGQVSTTTRTTDNTVLKEIRYENRKVYSAGNRGHTLSYHDVFYSSLTNEYYIRDNGVLKLVYRSSNKNSFGEYTYTDWDPKGGAVIYDVRKAVLTGNVISGITGYAPTESGFESGFGMDDIDYGNQQYAQRNAAFYTALEAENWIVNPYRSTHWDGLCFPAVLYNLQKEKQLRCKYVSCMETQLNAGMPSYVCDREFGMEACLYLDSAQWHVTGGGFWDNFGAGLLKSGLAALVGMGTYAAYSAACGSYLDEHGSPTSIVKGIPEVACGLGGTLLQMNEITAIFTADYWENFFGNGIPKDPAEIQDYCQGIDLNE